MIAGLLVLGWLALAIVVINPLLNELAPRLYHEQTGGALRFDELFFNPVDLSLRAHNLADRRPDGSAVWQVERLRIALAPVSLLRRALILDELIVTGIRADLRQTSADSWNFDAFLPPPGEQAEPPPAAEPEAPASLPWVEVRQLRIGIELFTVTAPYLAEPLRLAVQQTGLAARHLTTASGDATRRHLSWATLGAEAIGLSAGRIEVALGADDPVATHVEGFAIYIDHLALAGAEGQPFALALTDPGGGQLYWQGNFALETKQASGEVAIHDVELTPVWKLLRQRTGLMLASGSADARLDYRVDWRGALQIEVSKGAFTLRELALTGPDADTSAAIERIAIRGISVDSAAQRVAVERLTLTKPVVRGWNEESDVSLLQLIPPLSEEEEQEPAEPWQLQLGTARIVDGTVHWRASQLADPLRLYGIALTVNDVSWPAQGPAQIEFEAALTTAKKGGKKKASSAPPARLALAGELQPATLDGRFEGSIEDLPLALANPTLATLMPLAVDKGQLGATWRITLANGKPVSVSSSGALVDVELERTDRDRRLAAWQRLGWQEVAVNLEDNSLTIDRIDLVEPWFRFQINPDGTTNLSDLKPAAPAGTEPAGAVAAPVDSTADDTEHAAEADQPAPPWSVTLATLMVDDGTLIFADRSLPWPFRARIQGFTGSVTGISSDSEQAAQVDLRGNLADYAPVTLAGTVAPLADPPQLALALTFNEVDLALLSPYSRTYAGYAIDGGLLTVELAYRLEEELIRGSNRIVIRQLTLGEQVESAKAVDLPIRLALALLTDRRGVINLDVDVTGDLGDPQFGIGTVVRRAFFNAVSRVATSPFRFLGRLVGVDRSTAEALDHVDFEPGSVNLAEAQAEKVATIQRALQQRPGLRVHVVGHSNPAADEAALREEMWREELLETGLDEAELGATGEAWEEAVSTLYAEQFPEASDDLPPAEQAAALQAAIEVPEGRLKSLALRRAQAVKQALITGAEPLPPGRVFIDGNVKRREGVMEPRASLRLEG